LEFPSLKEKVLELYQSYNPDNLIVEKKASGAPLIYELRRMGIAVEEYTPVRGAANNPNTKMTRLNAVSDIFASGRVWAPNTQWAEEVIDEVASFPSSEHDDYTDTVSLALMRFRRGGFIQTRMDEEDDPRYFKRKVAGYY
jgi:predicted phage terminase large subunit-like protein